MAWKIIATGTPPIIEVIYDGVVSPSALGEAFLAALAAGKEHQTLSFLADIRGLTGGHSIVDLMDIVLGFEAQGVDRRLREAILVPAGTAIGPHAEFYETACRNRGFNSRIFTDRDEALAWLRKAPPAVM